MNETIEQGFLKGSCRHCKKHIEFPSDREGEWFDCPHCQLLTRLEPLGPLGPLAPPPRAVIEVPPPKKPIIYPGNFIYCPNCGMIATATTTVDGSFAIEVILWLFFLIPGVIYSVWRLTTRSKSCRYCGCKNAIHPNSPRAQQLMGVCLLLAIPLLAAGQAEQPLVTTNWIQAAPNFREISGQLYNVDRSVKFADLLGICTGFVSNGVYVATLDKRRSLAYSDRLIRSGNFLGSSSSGPSYRTEEIPTDELVLLKNFPTNRIEIGSRIEVRAMPGPQEKCEDGQILKTYDYGLPHIVPVLITNSVAGTQK